MKVFDGNMHLKVSSVRSGELLDGKLRPKQRQLHARQERSMMITSDDCMKLCIALPFILAVLGCQDGAASSIGANTGVHSGTSESTENTPTTGVGGSTGSEASSTSSGASMTGSTGSTDDTAEPDSSAGSTSTGVTSAAESTTDATTSDRTTSDTVASDPSTGATSGDESTTGMSEPSEPPEPPEPPPCFPKQVPWAQACQAGVKDVQILANIPNSAYGIAVDETHVYFTDYSPPGSPKLHRVSKCGGMVETLASAGSNPCRIEMDHLSVYISDLVDNGAIYRVSKFNGSVSVVTANLTQTCPSVAVTDDAILFTGHQQPGIWKVGKFWGGQPELAYATGGKHPGWMDTNGVHVYWNQSWHSDVERTLLTGGDVEVVTDELGSWPFEVSCDHVYGDSLSAPGFWRVPVNGGPAEKAALQSAHRSVMADTHVYFTSGSSNEIIEVPLAGGAPAVVAKVGNPGLLAVDATHVFWSDPDAPVIRIAPRPKI